MSICKLILSSPYAYLATLCDFLTNIRELSLLLDAEEIP
jgi:hypothetical protein